MDRLPDDDPELLFEQHKASGEPLTHDEIMLIVEASLADEDEFDNVGGGLWRWAGLDHPGGLTPFR